MDAVTRKGGLLYPMLVIAAIAVIVFSVTGIATMMGWLPSELSPASSAPKFEPIPRSELKEPLPAPGVPRAPVSDTQPGAAAPAACTNCGVVESIRAVGVTQRTRDARIE